MTDFTLTPDQMCVVLLAAQGLHQAPKRKARKQDVLETIRAMGVLQIDTIHIVNRSPYLVLYSRLGDYKTEWLEDLLAERAIFEYWAHAACFLPIEYYGMYRRFQLDKYTGWFHSEEWVKNHPEAVERVLAHVRANGGARSSDFERTDGQKGGWWSWKDEKIALEQLFNLGELMIARRHNFHRIYDLRERIMPDWNDADVPSADEVRRELIIKSVQTLGATPARWVHDYFRLKKTSTMPLVKKLADEGVLIRGQVASDDPLWKDPIYAHPDMMPLIDAAASGKLRAEHTTLLSPFDPIVWDRQRAVELFNFDYKIECYTPAPKRKYGYFTLPILHRGRLVGRLDPKAHRKEGIFEVKALHLEPGVEITDELATDLAATLKAIAAWHKTPEVVVRETFPNTFNDLLKRALN